MQPLTGVPIIDWVLGFMDVWGYALVLLFSVFENLFIIGSFTPGETIVMAAAFLSTPENGHLWLPVVWVLSVVGTMIGSNISYWFGRRGGRDGLLRYGRRFHVDEERVAAAEAYFYRHGSKTVFLSRFVAGFKNFVPVIAGVSRMPLAYFQGWTLLGAVAYTSIMCAIGYFVGENFERALAIARDVGFIGLAIIAGVIVALLVGRRRFSARRRDELLDEYAEELADEYGVEMLSDHLKRDEADES